MKKGVIQFILIQFASFIGINVVALVEISLVAERRMHIKEIYLNNIFCLSFIGVLFCLFLNFTLNGHKK